MKKSSLIDVFGRRPSRFKLLEKAAVFCKLHSGDSVVEIGCGRGDGIAMLCQHYGCTGIGIDFDAENIQIAKERHNSIPHLTFLQEDLYALQLEPEQFNVLVSEAAFSLLKNKTQAVAQFFRLLKPGGQVILHDFIVKENVRQEDRKKIDYIPCFYSIGTLEHYATLFRQAEFQLLVQQEKYAELISTSLYLSKQYQVLPDQIGTLFAELLSGGADNGQGCCSFFQQVKPSYAQMIFKKPE